MQVQHPIGERELGIADHRVVHEVQFCLAYEVPTLLASYGGQVPFADGLCTFRESVDHGLGIKSVAHGVPHVFAAQVSTMSLLRECHYCAVEATAARRVHQTGASLSTPDSTLVACGSRRGAVRRRYSTNPMPHANVTKPSSTTSIHHVPRPDPTASEGTFVSASVCVSARSDAMPLINEKPQSSLGLWPSGLWPSGRSCRRRR